MFDPTTKTKTEERSSRLESNQRPPEYAVGKMENSC